MFQRIRIKNFQSHKDTTVELTPGTNVIIGASDTGKSALFRAINWVCTNRPLGDAFRSQWGGDTSVTIETDDGHVIERIKGANENAYIVDGEPLRAFGAEVPQLVLDILRIDDASIRSQMDPPFLLASTPGEAARLLNSAASIDVIDRSISNLKKEQTHIDSSLKYNQTQLETLGKELKAYPPLNEIDTRLAKVEEDTQRVSSATTHVEAIKKLSRQGFEVKAKLSATQNIVEVDGRFRQLEDEFKTVQTKQAQNRSLKTITETASLLTAKLGKTEGVEEQLDTLRGIEKTEEEFRSRKSKLATLQTLLSRGRNVERTLEATVAELEVCEHTFKELVPETCPLCGAPWGGDHLVHI